MAFLRSPAAQADIERCRAIADSIDFDLYSPPVGLHPAEPTAAVDRRAGVGE
jgi:hypothetical protein